jgi:hypothetical protein
MAEETESVRKDSAERQLKQKEIVDWSGKRFVLPRGTTLPATGLPGEVFVLQRDTPLHDQEYIFDDEYNNWVTVGPSV